MGRGKSPVGNSSGGQRIIGTKELEAELNSANINRTSKDNNNNNLRIRAYLAEKYPDLEVTFSNDKYTGTVEVKDIKSKIEAQRQQEARNQRAASEMKLAADQEKFYNRVKTQSGNQKLYDSVKNNLEKSGFDEATIHRSHSVVGTRSFYVEGYGANIKISDHNTISQQLGHNTTAFIDIAKMTSMKEVNSKVTEILRKAKKGQF